MYTEIAFCDSPLGIRIDCLGLEREQYIFLPPSTQVQRTEKPLRQDVTYAGGRGSSLSCIGNTRCNRKNGLLLAQELKNRLQRRYRDKAPYFKPSE